MRHLVAHRKLGRTSSHRKALLRNLCTSLILNERLVTTLPKAKELRPFVEKVVTLGRRVSKSRQDGNVGDAVNATRQAAAYFFAGNANRDWSKRETLNTEGNAGITDLKKNRTAGVLALKKIAGPLAERFASRPGGYLRIIKLGRRSGDGAEMAIIEFIGSEEKKLKVNKDANWIS